jgi:hypothetical protein
MRYKIVLLASLLCLGTTTSWAGPYTDDLSRCLVEKTSEDDKVALVQWVVMALTQHPAVSSLAKTTAADVEKSNAAAGAVFTRLLAEDCADKYKNAVRYDGPGAIEAAFGVLGQVATRDLFMHAEVQAVMAGLAKHMDEDKLRALDAKQ